MTVQARRTWGAAAGIRAVMLPAAVLAPLVLAHAAHADGGAGGTAVSGCPSQGQGGTGYTGDNGTDAASLSYCDVGGGGGGGAGGGAGGAGGGATNSYITTTGGAGGAGGTALSPDGQDGSAGTDTGSNYYIPSGGGGGGGGYNGNGAGSDTLDNVGTLQGGDGGAGGAGGISDFALGGGGGGGGAGGYGAVITGAAAGINSGNIIGGKGGAGGDGLQSYGGAGGDGGVGLFFTAAGATLTNAGTIMGGDGGLGGAGYQAAAHGADGAGGAGVIGAGLTIDNSTGTIEGGLGGDGVTRAYAIIFTGGANSITGGSIVGGIDVAAGSFAPALSTYAVGTPLSIDGPLTFEGTSSYAVRLDGTTSDRADVTGAVNLNDTDVAATFTGGASILNQYTIMSASLGYYGSFGDVTTNLPSWVNARAVSSGADAYLDLSVDAANPDLTQNQQSVASALNTYFTDEGSLPSDLFGASSLSQLDGEVATGAQTASWQLTGQFLSLLTGTGGQAASAGSPAALGYADAPQHVAANDAYASLTGKASDPATATTWASLFGATASTAGDATVGSTNTDTASYGFAVGRAGDLGSGTTAGFALAAGAANWSLANSLGDGESGGVGGGVYARTESGTAYLSIAGAVGQNWFSTSRTVSGDTLTGDFDGQNFGARAEAGYRLPGTGGIGITPFVAGEAQGLATPAYSETDQSGGNLGLSYAAKTATEAQTELGAEFDATTRLAGNPVQLFSRIAWAHRWGDAPALAAAFTTLPGTGFTVSGAAAPADVALLGLGARVNVNGRLSWQAGFNGAFGAGSETYAGTAAVRYQW